ncbi:hypothetical protein F4810DRAFT_715084 [Camillea tinctor]|nr:hypothetical protein F4810DRAFT_715084 [Camillea tinctor]
MDHNNALWARFQAHIPELTVARPTKNDTRSRIYHPGQEELLPSPITRDMDWNPQFKGAKNVNGYADNIVAAMQYAVGISANEPCRVCQNESGPFRGCILPPSGSNMARYACANCRWNWKYKGCEHNPNFQGHGSADRDQSPAALPLRQTRSQLRASLDITAAGPSNIAGTGQEPEEEPRSVTGQPEGDNSPISGAGVEQSDVANEVPREANMDIDEVALATAGPEPESEPVQVPVPVPVPEPEPALAPAQPLVSPVPSSAPAPILSPVSASTTAPTAPAPAPAMTPARASTSASGSASAPRLEARAAEEQSFSEMEAEALRLMDSIRLSEPELEPAPAFVPASGPAREPASEAAKAAAVEDAKVAVENYKAKLRDAVEALEIAKAAVRTAELLNPAAAAEAEAEAEPEPTPQPPSRPIPQPATRRAGRRAGRRAPRRAPQPAPAPEPEPEPDRIRILPPIRSISLLGAQEDIEFEFGIAQFVEAFYSFEMVFLPPADYTRVGTVLNESQVLVRFPTGSLELSTMASVIIPPGQECEIHNRHEQMAQLLWCLTPGQAGSHQTQRRRQ